MLGWPARPDHTLWLQIAGDRHRRESGTRRARWPRRERRCPRRRQSPCRWVMCLMRPLALWTPLRGHLPHQCEPSWNGKKAKVGGDALGPDTTGRSERQQCRPGTIAGPTRVDRAGCQAGTVDRGQTWEASWGCVPQNHHDSSGWR